MRQLTSLDSQFPALETRRQTGHVASVAILDPSTAPGATLTVADIEALVTERLPLLSPLRWRLLEVPLGLDYPYWNSGILTGGDANTASQPSVAQRRRR
jgi:diacylglycerol O-acyltransferase